VKETQQPGQETWRTLLRSIYFSFPTGKRQEFLDAVGVSRVSLERWIKGEANPHTSKLQTLLLAIPRLHRGRFLRLLREEFPGFLPLSDEGAGDVEKPEMSVPSLFYEEILRTHWDTAPGSGFKLICTSLLHTCLTQLDPVRLGMEIVVVQCMPPRLDQRVRSLRQRLSLGTPPWHTYLQEKVRLFGLESLAGYVVSSGRSFSESRDQCTFVQLNDHPEVIESLFAAPLRRADHIAGCLLFFSTQPDHFSQERRELIERYLPLFNLAFRESDFSPPSQIALSVMPPPAQQEVVARTIHSRTAEKMLQAARSGRPISYAQAEELAWGDVEQVLLGDDPGTAIQESPERQEVAG